MRLEAEDPRRRTVDWTSFVEAYVESFGPGQLRALAEDLWRIEGYESFEHPDTGPVDFVARKDTPVPVRSVVRVVERANAVKLRETARAADEYGNVVDAVVLCQRAAEDCRQVTRSTDVNLVEPRGLAYFVVSRNYHWPFLRRLLDSSRRETQTEDRVFEARVEFADLGGRRGVVGRGLASRAGLSRGGVIQICSGGPTLSVSPASRLSLRRERLTLDPSLRDEVDAESGVEVEFSVAEAGEAERVKLVSTHEILETERLRERFEGEAVYRGYERSVELSGERCDGRLMVVDAEPGPVARAGRKTTFQQVSFRQIKDSFS